MKKIILSIALAAGITSFANNSRAQDLYVGSNTPNNTTNFTSGTNSYSNTYVGYNTNASNNLLTVVNSGTLLTNSTSLYIGYNGSSNSLVVSNEGSVVNSNGYIGYNASSSNNLLMVNGGTWRNSGYVYVGNSGSGNSLVISNEAKVIVSGVTNNWFAVGENDGANDNTLIVTGTNSSLAVNGWLEVSWGSNSGNSMMISNGGSVTDQQGYVGYTNGSSSNSVTVTGSNSLWSNSENLYVGYFGKSNCLVISNGGKVLDQNGSVGFHGGGNTALVTGTNSLWSNATSFYVGNCGSDSLLVVSNGGGIISSNGYIAEISRWSNCGALITGSGSYWSNSGSLTIGSIANGGNNPSSGNSLVISNGGVVTDISATIAAATNFYSNSILVTGSNSLWSNSGNLYLGYAGSSNTLVISNRGMLINGGQDSTGGVIGFNTNSSGNSVVVSGSGSTWRSAGDVVIGYSGTGNRLEVSNGGTVSNGVVSYAGGVSGGIIGFNAGSTDNSVLVTGIGSRWISGGDLFVGFNGAGNSMVISNGGIIANSQVNFGGVLGWGSTSSNNSVLVTGSNSLWTNSGDLYVGYDGSSNSLVISNGGKVADGNGYIGHINTSSKNSVLVTGAGSLWSNSGSLMIGASNTLTVANGGTVVAVGGISNSGTVTGNGTIGGATTIASGGTLTPGSVGVGSLSFTNGLSLQTGATTTFQINTAANFTSINILGNSITYGGNLVFNIFNYSPAAGDTFTLFNMTGGALQSGDFTSVTAGSLVFADNSGIWRANDGSYLYQFSDSTGQLTVQSAPEPSTYLLFGIGAIGMLMVLRRKKKTA